VTFLGKEVDMEKKIEEFRDEVVQWRGVATSPRLSS
jgi:hypothetical protein